MKTTKKTINPHEVIVERSIKGYTIKYRDQKYDSLDSVPGDMVVALALIELITSTLYVSDLKKRIESLPEKSVASESSEEA